MKKYLLLGLALGLALALGPDTVLAQAGAGLPVQWSEVPDWWANAVMDYIGGALMVAVQIAYLLIVSQ